MSERTEQTTGTAPFDIAAASPAVREELVKLGMLSAQGVVQPHEAADRNRDHGPDPVNP